MAKNPLPDEILNNHKIFLAFLRKRLGSREEAEEILQASYLKGLQKSGGIKKNESTVAWFYRVLRNALIDHYRRKATESKALAQYTYEHPRFSKREEIALEKTVCACVKKLIKTAKPEYAEILQKVDLDDLSVTDYARHAGVSANNATVRVHRARQNLKKRLLKTCGACAQHGCLDCSCQH